MRLPQTLLAGATFLGAANTIRQAFFATADISPALAGLSAVASISAAAAWYALHRRHRLTSHALALFAGILPAATVVGSELLLGDALPLPERLPGYLLAVAVGAAAWRGGRAQLREAAREGAIPIATAPSLPPADAPPAVAAPAFPFTPRVRARAERGRDA